MARYLQIASELKSQILEGAYAPAEQLPSQRELARRWRTTVMTIRQALDVLREAGVIRIEHGTGTFVADLGIGHDMLYLSSFADEVASKNLTAETRLLSLDLKVRHASANDALGISRGSTTVTLARLRLIGGLPIIYQRSYIPGRYRELITGYDPAGPLYGFLRDRIGLIATSYQETLTSCLLPQEIATLLSLEQGSVALFSRRTSYTDDGKPFLYDEAYMPAARVELRVFRRGKRYTVEYLPSLARDR
ncbi:MAG: GntR family transcriptional regulator [Chloroflexi bacterium]|nr:GntR family transcriptional regulator [Chloroflexota bacterium]MDA8188112.1 GntR family transcriptional regulator [Dehalococcoidales bacterium]